MSNFVECVSKDKSTHGVSEKYVPKSNIDENLEELDRDGYTILKKAFSEEDCAKAKEKIDKEELEFLKDAIKNGKNPYHTFAFTTIKNRYPESRTVVLRGFKLNPLTIQI